MSWCDMQQDDLDKKKEREKIETVRFELSRNQKEKIEQGTRLYR